jgi:hypothetical protein
MCARDDELCQFANAISVMIEKGGRLNLHLPVYLLKMIKLHLLAHSHEISDAELRQFQVSVLEKQFEPGSLH